MTDRLTRSHEARKSTRSCSVCTSHAFILSISLDSSPPVVPPFLVSCTRHTRTINTFYSFDCCRMPAQHTTPPPLSRLLSFFPQLRSMVHQDLNDLSSPPIRGWMLMATDDRVLLTLRPPFLVTPAPGLPDGVQLRVRAAPEGTASEASR